MLAIRPRKEWKWCSDDDLELPEDQRTYWVLGSLTERDRVELNDRCAATLDPMTNMVMRREGMLVYLTVRAGLRGLVEGSKFKDADGKEIPFEVGDDGKVTDGFLDHVRWVDQQAMFLAINAPTVLEVEEKEG